MDIGVPRERRADEHRVGITPTGLRLMVADGHRCYVEQGAGLGGGFTDEDFAKAGAKIVYSGDEVYGRADLILKVARPTAEELNWFRSGQTVMAFWHLASASPDNLDALLKHNITAVAYEIIQADDGTLPVLTPMSQIAGKMAASVAAGLLRNDRGGKGILLGGVPGVPPAEVIILGAGVVGTYAARTFAALGASVYVLDKDLGRLERISLQDPHIVTMVSHSFNVRKVAHFADVLVGAVLVPGSRAPILVTRDMVREMKPRSVILDVAIDQGGCVETSRPTSHHTPTFLAENVIHYCVPNMPGVLGRTATHALNIAAWPFMQLIASHGAQAAIAQNRMFARGVLTHQGKDLRGLQDLAGAKGEAAS
ncbi:MAG TPA: alanine dehydrogenase [Anaerolineales bacterium]|nr:alanine dehydrogenase [Anaerolineales bacterium]